MECTAPALDVQIAAEGCVIDLGSLYADLARLHDKRHAHGLRHALVTVLVYIFLTVMYHPSGVSLPVGFALITKIERYLDKKTGQPKRRSPISKNEYYQRLTQQAVLNQIPFTYVLNDIWYASADNMMFVKHRLHKEFVMPLKANRKVALSLTDKLAGHYVRADTLTLESQTVREVYLEQVGFPLLIVKQVFTNEDASVDLQYLVSSDTTLSYDDITTLFKNDGMWSPITSC